jgi:hypothetical protein
MFSLVGCENHSKEHRGTSDGIGQWNRLHHCNHG